MNVLLEPGSAEARCAYQLANGQHIVQLRSDDGVEPWDQLAQILGFLAPRASARPSVLFPVDRDPQANTVLDGMEQRFSALGFDTEQDPWNEVLVGTEEDDDAKLLLRSHVVDPESPILVSTGLLVIDPRWCWTLRNTPARALVASQILVLSNRKTPYRSLRPMLDPYDLWGGIPAELVLAGAP